MSKMLTIPLRQVKQDQLTFTGLTDTPGNYTRIAATYLVRVHPGADSDSTTSTTCRTRP